MLSIFSHVYRTSVCLIWRNVCFKEGRGWRVGQKRSLTVNLQSTHTKLRNFGRPGQREGELKGEKNKANFSEPPGRSYISRRRGGRGFQASQTIQLRTSHPLVTQCLQPPEMQPGGEKKGLGPHRGHQVSPRWCVTPSSVRTRNSWDPSACSLPSQSARSDISAGFS